MTVTDELRELAFSLAASVTGGDEEARADGARRLSELGGREWLALDQAARSFRYGDGMPIGGLRGWLAPDLVEPTGLVAATTSMHMNGRFREAACDALGSISTPVATAALSVRLLDHVPQVRAAAWRSLAPRIGTGESETVLDILLSGRGRLHAPAATSAVRDALLASRPPSEIANGLMVSELRDVRRWAFTFAHERGLLDERTLVESVRTQTDQYLQALCADWLTASSDPHVFRALLGARSVEARLIGLTKVSDEDLDERSMSNLLTDRAPRVRDQARWRARRRGLDLPAFYRDRLAEPGRPPRERAACLDALATLGSAQDLDACAERLEASGPRVRAAAVQAVLALAPRDRAVQLLRPLLGDPSPRVSAAASVSLAHLDAPARTADDAWTSAQPWSRRAAWRLSRAAGGWDRVEADLRAAGDDVQDVAGLGLSGIDDWIKVGAATTWQPLGEEQRLRIRALLEAGSLSGDRQRIIAFCAGVQEEPKADDGPPTPQSRDIRSRASRVLGRFRRR